MTLFAVACAGHVPAAAPGPARGSSTGCCPIRTRWRSGRSSAARWSGTSSRSRTYFTVSLLFWYIGLIPDLATLRDRAPEPRRASRLRHAGDGLARLGAVTGIATRRPTCCWPGWRRRWWSRCTRVVSFDFAVADRARLALDDLPALLRGRRDLLRLRHGADARDPAARGLRPARTSSPCGTSTTWPRSCWRPA